jgi:hypothetical protein
VGRFDSHKAFIDRVVQMLKAQKWEGIQPSDIQVMDFPFSRTPAYGLIVSPIDETEGTGVNSSDDIRYGLQVVRVLGGVSDSDGIMSRQAWRSKLRDMFHRKRIGVQLGNACEIITTVRFGTIKLRREWDRSKIDASAVFIYCLVREPRD